MPTVVRSADLTPEELRHLGENVIHAVDLERQEMAAIRRRDRNGRYGPHCGGPSWAVSATVASDDCGARRLGPAHPLSCVRLPRPDGMRCCSRSQRMQRVILSAENLCFRSCQLSRTSRMMALSVASRPSSSRSFQAA